MAYHSKQITNTYNCFTCRSVTDQFLSCKTKINTELLGINTETYTITEF